MAGDEEDIFLEDLLLRGAYALEKQQAQEEENKKKFWFNRAYRDIPRTKEDGKTAVERFKGNKAGKVMGAAGDVLGEVVEGYAGAAADATDGMYPGDEVIAGVAKGRIATGGKAAVARAGKRIAETSLKGVVNIKEKRKVGKYLAIFAGIGLGVAIGAVIGTLVFPGIGTAVGGAIGAGIVAVSGVTAGVILGVIGGWIGMKSAQAISKQATKNSPEKFKLYKKIANDLSNKTKLSTKELTQLNAYVRNRESNLKNDSQKEAKHLSSIRKRVFKRGSQQGVEHMMYFLVDEAKALDGLTNPTPEQESDKDFIKSILGKLKEAKGLDLAARNHVRVEYAGERASVNSKLSSKLKDKMSQHADLLSLSNVFTRKEKQKYANKEGAFEVKGYKVSNEINAIRVKLDELKNSSKPQMMVPVFTEIDKLHESYGVKEEVLKYVQIGMQNQRKEMKRKFKKAQKKVAADDFKSDKAKAKAKKTLVKAQNAFEKAKRYERLTDLQLKAVKAETAAQMALIHAQDHPTSKSINKAHAKDLKAKKARRKFLVEKIEVDVPRERPNKKKAAKAYDKQQKLLEEAKLTHKNAKKASKDFKKACDLNFTALKKNGKTLCEQAIRQPDSQTAMNNRAHDMKKNKVAKKKVRKMKSRK